MIAPTEVDVIVVGAGPAGLSAAGETASHGQSVLILDEQPAAGGQVWRNAEDVIKKGGVLSRSYVGAGEAIAGLSKHNSQYYPGATLISADASADGVEIAWLARGNADQRQMIETRGRALIIATGAQERALAFPGGELPGVMGVGAIQTAMKQSGLLPTGGENGGVVLAGQGPLLLLTLTQIIELGGQVDAVLNFGQPQSWRRALAHLPGALVGDLAIMMQGLRLMRQARVSGAKVFHQVSNLRADGEGAIERVKFRSADQEHDMPCSVLGVHDGVIANTQLTRLLNLEHHWDEAQKGFIPTLDARGKVAELPVWVAGDAAGIAGAKAALLRGRLCALDASHWLGGLDASERTRKSQPLEQKLARFSRARRLIEVLYSPLPVSAFAEETTRLCRCEAVTFADVRAALKSGAQGPNQVKTFTRCGMGPCQGRMCSNGLTRLIAEELDVAPDEVGALRIRPPLKPVLVRDYIALSETAS